MPLTCDETIDAVALLIARRRLDRAARSYTAADAIDDNAEGWSIDDVGTVQLPAEKLDDAWTASTRILRAWA